MQDSNSFEQVYGGKVEGRDEVKIVYSIGLEGESNCLTILKITFSLN